MAKEGQGDPCWQRDMMMMMMMMIYVCMSKSIHAKITKIYTRDYIYIYIYIYMSLMSSKTNEI